MSEPYPSLSAWRMSIKSMVAERCARLFSGPPITNMENSLKWHNKMIGILLNFGTESLSRVNYNLDLVHPDDIIELHWMLKNEPL